MAQHVKINLEMVAPKLYKKLKQLEKMDIFQVALNDTPILKKISVLGLDIMKLPKEFTRFKYPISIKNGGDYITDEDWIDLKGIATIEVHFNKEIKFKNVFLVA